MRLFFRKIQMNSLKKLLIYTLALVLGLASCKKNNDETLPTISGTIDYTLPLYGAIGAKFNLTAMGQPYPSDVNFSWVCLGLNKDTVKGREVSFVIPDSLATYTVQLRIEKDGYSLRTQTRYITSVSAAKKDGSITGVVYPKEIITDTRDNNEYPIMKIGNLYWFTENLRWAGTKDKPVGTGYAGTDIMGQTLYGRLYNWSDATENLSGSGLGGGPQGICPDGWSIPTNEDWIDFATVLNNNVEVPFVDNWSKLGEKVIPQDAKFNDVQIWPFSGNTWPSNAYQWNAIPAGNCINDYSNFDGLNLYAFWWSSTEKDANNANYRYIYYDQPDFPMNYSSKTGFGISVRCVKKVN